MITPEYPTNYRNSHIQEVSQSRSAVHYRISPYHVANNWWLMYIVCILFPLRLLVTHNLGVVGSTEFHLLAHLSVIRK